LVVSGQPKLALGVDQPVTLKADEQWAPITGSLDIVPGSALDFRPLGLLDAPAGRHGWLVARGPKLVYEQRPDKPVRYYGVNFCFSALYLDKALADRAADRLAALGYNSVRIHHYESGLVAPGPNSLTFKPEALDKLDYFAAALKQRGLYLTTDLFVSRPIRAAETVEGGTDMNGYKSAVLVSDVARDNLKAFTCALLTHVNPYTKLAWGQDPALNMLSLVNEGAALNFIGGLKGKLRDLYVARFNAWLAARYGTREKLAEAWGGALKAGQDLAAGTVPLPGGTGGANGRDLALFAARLQSDFADDMKRFLRDELKCRALITDMNARSDNWGTQLARTHLDYVDNHGYWDHPRFLEREWQLPSKGWSGGGSATARGVPLHGDKAATRLLDRPFGFSEFNYAAPNVYRAESGPLTGGYAALQDWDAVWRFSYSHDVRNLQALRGGNFFDMATDLTQQAGDRFAVLLFLRDAASARAKVALTATQAELTGVKGPGLGLPGVQRLALVSQVGTLVDPQAPAAAGELRVSGGVNEAALLARLREQGLLAKDNPTNPDQDLYVSDTGQLRLDSRQGLFCFDTPRCQGVFSAFGRGAKVGALTTADGGAPIGVYLASLGETPIPTSPRLLLAHVPDTQGTGRRFGERALLTLFDWGGLPQLVRDVSTTITLALEQPAAYKVYALGLDGGRLASVETQVVGGALRFTARSRQGETGSLYYELTR